MEEKNKDTFEISQNKSLKKRENLFFNNFFMNENSTNIFIKNYHNTNSRSINDYDLNLLQEDAYKDVSDEVFKLEYKIHKIEQELKEICSQLQAAIDINDYELIKKLSLRKSFLEDSHKNLIVLYNEKSLSTRISDGISNILGFNTRHKINSQKNTFFQNLYEKLVSKLPSKYLSLFELKKSLNKLESINKSVDELVTMKSSYNDNLNKYDQLSKYILKANSIQAQIKNSIKKK